MFSRECEVIGVLTVNNIHRFYMRSFIPFVKPNLPESRPKY